MKLSVILSIGLAGASSAHYVKSLTEYTKDLPQCAVAAMKIGMKNQGCNLKTVDAKDFDCICDNYLDIDGHVYAEVDHSCAADYASAAGILCGAWEVESTTASDLPQATKALADILGVGAPKVQATGDAARDDNSAATTPSQQAKDTAPVKNRASVPTGRIVRSFGGAAAAAAVMHL
ncbi:hypothetical protein BBO_08845 [Beauveria brongniartii RCEF 3172]|uniref:Extracellular membrane protein, CFEM domain protein n=1 Tax=Beauveria brongniartii RCEF 3172 TaxID=1081107 RepID=A0A166WYX7_9HYPO|nr:hypothetical protein BBO_08845 [Beauveria brongniartii RCEF 3172]